MKWHYHRFKGDINVALCHYCMTNMWQFVLKKKKKKNRPNFLRCAVNPWDTSTMVDDPLFVHLELHSGPFWPSRAWPRPSWQETAKPSSDENEPTAALWELISRQKGGSSYQTPCCVCTTNRNQFIIITLQIISCDLRVSHWSLTMTDTASVTKWGHQPKCP